MRFAYADPPYLGCSVRLYGDHPDAAVYDTVAGHEALIERLCDEFYDGWAMSMGSQNLQTLLPLCPTGIRVMAWVKPFASFKPNVPVAYAWEPVIVYRGRPRNVEQDTVRDWCSANITMQKGVPGAKPLEFCFWLFSVLNVQPCDEFVDLFPGSGNVSTALEMWRRQQRLFA